MRIPEKPWHIKSKTALFSNQFIIAEISLGELLPKVEIVGHIIYTEFVYVLNFDSVSNFADSKVFNPKLINETIDFYFEFYTFILNVIGPLEGANNVDRLNQIDSLKIGTEVSLNHSLLAAEDLCYVNFENEIVRVNNLEQHEQLLMSASKILCMVLHPVFDANNGSQLLGTRCTIKSEDC